MNTPARTARVVVKMCMTHSHSTTVTRVTYHDRATISFTYGVR